ncbi:MAG: SpoIIE family protein phosphatase [bacterium]|nr:SpoIIE family protein phosphatase [bacterium]
MTDQVVNKPHEWPDARHYRRSLRWQFPLYLVGMVILLMTAAGYLFTRQHVAEVTSNVVNRLLVQAQSHAVSAAKDILNPNGPDVLLLNNLCRELAVANPGLYWAGVTDEEGSFLAHTDIRLLTGSGRLNLPETPEDTEAGLFSSQVYVVNETLYVYVPVKERDLTVGHLALASSVSKIQEARIRSIIAVLSATVIILLIGIPLILWLIGRELRPINTIVTHLRKVDPNNLSFDIPVRGKNELAYLAETLRVMGSHLKTAQEERLQSERMVRELEIAREIQMGILPRTYPSGATFDFYGTYVSANEVGGDYYDFFPFDNDRLGFLIADVSGKSLPGMLVMLMTRDIIRRVANGNRDPRSVLCDLNKELLATIRQGMFVTMLYGLLDQRTGQVTIASAGHNPLIWISNSQPTPTLVRPPGYPLGLMAPAVFDQRIKNETIQLATDDWLIQFTDGVNEARNPAGAEYGMDRLLANLKERRHLRPIDLVKQSLAEHASFVAAAPQHDDITLVAMKWTGLAGEKSIQETGQYAATN